jgi:hypothetical protein
MTPPQWRGAFIYLKESEMRLLPIEAHRLTPILFAESGRMPSHKGKLKDCFIVINFAALYFIRPSNLIGTQYKIASLFPTDQINRITFDNPKKRTIATKLHTSYFICDHADEAISCLYAAHSIFHHKTSHHRNLILQDFPSKIEPIRVTDLVNSSNLAQIRSVCVAVRYRLTVSENLLILLGRLESGRSRSLLLDEQCTDSGILKCLSVPVVKMGGLAVIHFRNCAPYAVCSLVYGFLKRSPTIRGFIFEGYTHLVPHQLKFGKCVVHGKSPVSLIFKDCVLSEDVFCNLIDEISKLQADLQRLTFNGINLNKRTWKHFVRAFGIGNCFRCIEVLELDQIEVSGITLKMITKGVNRIVQRARCIRRFTLARFTPKISVQLWPFMNNNFLHEILLRGQDFSEPFSPFVVPHHVHSFSFRECRFTSSSFASILQILSEVNTPITLEFTDLKMSERGWGILFQELPELPKIPRLKELDWSGNPLPRCHVNTFVSYFFATKSIRFLGLDRIFTPQSIDTLLALATGIGANQLFGISLNGDKKHNFSRSFRLLLPVLQALGDISLLHLVKQLWEHEDINHIVHYTSSHSTLFELAVDGTRINQFDHFFNFYHRLCTETELRSLSRPNIDLERLFKGAPPPDSIPVDQLRTSLQRLPTATNASVRSFYLCEMNKDEISPRDLFPLWLRYPRCFLIGHISDPFFLLPPVTGSEFVTLGSLFAPGIFPGLNQLLPTFIAPPTWLPEYPSSPGVISDEFASQSAIISQLPNRYSSVEIACLDESGQGDANQNVETKSLREEDESHEDLLDESPDILLTVPQPIAHFRSVQDGIGYYQSFGEGLTINLDLPIFPLNSPLPPDEDDDSPLN